MPTTLTDAKSSREPPAGHCLTAFSAGRESRPGTSGTSRSCRAAAPAPWSWRRRYWFRNAAEVEAEYDITIGSRFPKAPQVSPRQADIVFLRRTAAVQPPFRGLWRFLAPWNVLEYKGPTVAARREHVPFLVEVGLGIARRLNEQAIEQGERPTPEGDMEQQIAVGQFVIETAERADKYGSHFAAFHEAAWEEVMKMAKRKRGGLEFNLRPIIETMGMRKVIEQLGEKELVEAMGIDRILANLTPAQRRELERRVTGESERKGS
jgi:hypothetical protein